MTDRDPSAVTWSPRVGVIGAIRRRNGTGPFIARLLQHCGATVTAVAARTPSGAREAAAQLATSGLDVVASHSVSELLRREDLDAVAICSPAECHADHLSQALECSRHAFCEKPLVWTETENLVSLARPLVTAFSDAGLVLHQNTQWRYIGPIHSLLYPAERARTPRELRLELAPPCADPLDMVRESVPHALSVLLDQGGTSTIRKLRVSLRADRHELSVSLTVRRHPHGLIRVTAILLPSPSQPRPAAIEINGARLEREITMPHYQVAFHAEDRRVAFDPMHCSVEQFVLALRRTHSGARPQTDSALLPGLALLQAVRDELVRTSPSSRPGRAAISARATLAADMVS